MTKQTLSILAILAVAGLPHATAQHFAPPITQPPSGNTGGGDTSYSNNSKKDESAKSLFGAELPFLDAQNDTVTFNGKTWRIGKGYEAKFRTYISCNGYDPKLAKEYAAIFVEINQILTPQPLTPDAVSKTVTLLRRASKFSMDSDVSDALITNIYGVYKSKALQASLREDQRNLLKENERINRDLKEFHKQIYNFERDSLGKKNVTSDPRVEFLRKRIIELEVIKQTNDAKVIALDIQDKLTSTEAKVHYQAQLVFLFAQRRFQHVIVGCQIYNFVFHDQNSKLEIEEGSDVDKLFGDTLGVPLTIATMQSVAAESKRYSEETIQAASNLIKSKKLQAATKRLTEAYLVGEFMAPVYTFPAADRKKVENFMDDADLLINAIDYKDYTEARAVLERMKSVAIDFNYSAANSAIDAYTGASDMHLASARTKFLAGKPDEAETDVREAKKLWPSNPRFKELEQFLQQGDALLIAKNDFIRLLKEKNYRQIAADPARYIVAVKGDPELEEAMKQIQTNITKIEMMLAQARELSAQGLDYTAWEAMQEMREDPTFAEDSELGRAIEKIAPRVASLTVPLEKAIQNQENKELGTALAWYLKAKDVYPMSKMAQRGINKILKEIWELEQFATESEED